MKRTTLWATVFCLAIPAALWAEEPKPAAPPDPQKIQEEMEKADQQFRKQQEESLQRLKQVAPQAYESQKKTLEQQGQINQIMAAYHQKSISAEDAERRLTSLIKQQVEQELAGLDTQIKMMEKKLASLRQAKGNPSALVKKRVDQMLGRGGPSNPEEMM